MLKQNKHEILAGDLRRCGLSVIAAVAIKSSLTEGKRNTALQLAA